ncbi:MAG: hypothetical protein KAS32_29530 [Candidatus Peribacteraceae bacterium]|nr:hypothetical protein [Candidatus Peribacteraceae bacterium]
MKDINDIENEIEQLTEFVEMDGPNSDTECTEALIHLSIYSNYMSDELCEVLTTELLGKLKYYQTCTEKVEEEVISKRRVVSLKHL